MKQLLAPLLAVTVVLPSPVFAEDAWDVTPSGSGPYTLTFTGSGSLSLSSDKPFTIAGETVTSKTIDITETKTFEVATKEALNLTITGADASSKVLVLNAPAEPAEEAPEEPAGEPEAEAPALGKGTVEGTVWFDEDGDGIRQDGEEVMSDVLVYLVDPNDDVVAETMTEDGAYSFKGVVPGEYSIAIDATDFDIYTYTQEDAGDESRDSDVDQYGFSELFELKDGTHVIDAGAALPQDEEQEGLLLMANFVDADRNQEAGMKEETIPATYTVYDSEGTVIGVDEAGKDDVGMALVDPGSYTMKIDVPKGYTFAAIHRTSFEALLSTDLLTGLIDLEAEEGEILKSEIASKLNTEDMEPDSYEDFMERFERVAPNAPTVLEEGGIGHILLAELTPAVKETSSGEEDAGAKVEEEAVPMLPEAGEDTPFPYAKTGLAALVLGAWLFFRRP